ncbi:MAG: hypothetical protein WEE89_04915 [Gemmatimonadota bacterium]
MMERRCTGKNATGEPCEKPSRLVGDDGWCDTHRPGSTYMSDIGALGGQATKEKFEAKGLNPGEMPDVTDTATALQAFNVVGRAHGERRLTDREADSHVKRIDATVKALNVHMTGRLVTELAAELERKETQIQELRKQLNATPRMAVAR